jgi:pilus assembly protein Flp/PilA
VQPLLQAGTESTMSQNTLPNLTTPARHLSNAARRMLADQRGTTAIEYALIAAGIGVAVATIVWSLGSSVVSLYQNIANLLS